LKFANHFSIFGYNVFLFTKKHKEMNKPIRYGIIDNEVMLNPKITINAKVVYAAFCCHANTDLECFPGNVKLAKYLNVSSKYISRAVSELKDLGIITRKQRGYNGPSMTEIMHGISFRKGKMIGHPLEKVLGPEGLELFLNGAIKEREEVLTETVQMETTPST
jgi:hypothetical protein